MSLSKKIIILTITFIVLLPIYYYGQKFYQIFIAKRSLDNDFYKVASELNADTNSQIGVLTKGEKPHISKSLAWGNKTVRIITEYFVDKTNYNSIHIFDVIQLQNTGTNEWLDFKKETSFCATAFIWQDQLGCIVSSSEIGINFIAIDGMVQYKKLVESTVSNFWGPYLKDNKLYFVWQDERIHYFNPLKLDKILSPSEDDYYGPNLIIAGELNLDTREFKEHIIKYDSTLFP